MDNQIMAEEYAISQDKQREITKLCIQTALLLLQHGAESMLVEQLSTRLGLALGVHQVETAISANAVVLTTIVNGHCQTSTRKIVDRGINMHVVTEVQHIVILVEHHLADIDEARKRFEHIKPLRYPRWIIIVMVALSCGCFSKLNGGDWDGFLVSALGRNGNVGSSAPHSSSSKSFNQLLYHGICCDISIRFIAKTPLFSSYCHYINGRERSIISSWISFN